jgi:hypothetical protein
MRHDRHRITPVGLGSERGRFEVAGQNQQLVTRRAMR